MEKQIQIKETVIRKDIPNTSDKKSKIKNIWNTIKSNIKGCSISLKQFQSKFSSDDKFKNLANSLVVNGYFNFDVVSIFNKDIENYLFHYTRKLIFKRESLVSDIIHDIFVNFIFIKVRPKFLRRSNGRCLELDRYNEKLKVAFEINGIQHYMYIPFFHKKGIEQLYEQQVRDKFKLDVCNKLGIKLIIIKYDIPESQIKTYILEQLEINSITF